MTTTHWREAVSVPLSLEVYFPFRFVLCLLLGPDDNVQRECDHGENDQQDEAQNESILHDSLYHCAQQTTAFSQLIIHIAQLQKHGNNYQLF